MKPADTRTAEGWSVLSGCSLAAAAGCGIGAVWVGTVDVAGWVEHRIGAARGAISEETLAWLRAADFRGQLFWLGAGLLMLGWVAWRGRVVLRRWIEAEATVGVEESPTWKIALGGFLAVWVRYHLTLTGGFFRYDDFELLAVAQERSLWESIWLPHGDHFMPLTRVMAWAGLKFFGVTAWPYNTVVLLAMGGAVAMGCGLLRELRVSAAAQIVFVTLVVGWSPWAELMAGYYVLTTYVMIAVLGMGAIGCYLRWRRRPRARWAVGLALSVLAAMLIDVSGWYVPAACAVFVGADFFVGDEGGGIRAWWVRNRGVLVPAAVAGGIGLGCALYAYGVLHRGAFLSMGGGGGGRSFARLAAEFGYLFDVGLLVSMVTPFVYARLPVMVLGLLGGAVLVGGIFFSVAAVRAADRRGRVVLGAIALVVAGTCLMVNLGRPSEETLVVRWAAKHLCPAYLWLCVLMAVGWDARWRRMEGRRRVRFAEVTLTLLVVFAGLQTAFGRIGMAVAFPPFGYPAEIRDAGRRREAVEKLRSEIVGRISRGQEAICTAPTLDGAFLQARIPSLFDYNLSHYAPFLGGEMQRVRWVRNAAMQTWHTDAVATAPVLREAVSPEFLAALARERTLREFYFGEVALRSEVRREAQPGAGIEISGKAEFVVRATSWEPEAAPRLRLAVERMGAGEKAEVPIVVIFRGDASGADWRGRLSVRSEVGRVTSVDLRQAYAFALSRRVENLRIVIAEPGRFRVWLAEIGP